MGGEIVDKGDFISKLIFPNQEMTKSGKLFRDKISVTLPSSVYTMQLLFTDINSSNYSSSYDQFYILIYPFGDIILVKNALYSKYDCAVRYRICTYTY